MPDIDGRELTPEEQKEISGASVALVLAATDRDLAECVRIVSTIGGVYGHRGVGLLCCAMANAVVKMTGLDSSDNPDSFAGFQIQTADGRTLSPEELPAEVRPVAWAHRFVVAWANDSAEGAIPLFYGMVDNQDEALAGVSALVHMTGEYGRRALRQRKEEQARLN